MAQAHKDFHKAASDIVKRKDQGEYVRLEVVLGAHSDFIKASEKVVSLLMDLKRFVRK